MAIPKFTESMLPILKTVGDGQEYAINYVYDSLDKKYFHLTDEEKAKVVSNGTSLYKNRVGWGLSYLKQSGLLKSTKRGFIQITDLGKSVLLENINEITFGYLKKFPLFNAFRSGGKKEVDNQVVLSESNIEELSPIDLIDSGFQKLNHTLKSDLISKVKEMNPYIFERLVLKLLKKMGYGDFIETSRSNDGGIDGIINEDELGLGKIYLQCKRYNDSKVREPEIRNFIGAMNSDTNKGIFVTTSDFDSKAIEKARMANHIIVLINGERLVELMIKFNIGVQSKQEYIVKEIDHDFFDEE